MALVVPMVNTAGLKFGEEAIETPENMVHFLDPVGNYRVEFPEMGFIPIEEMASILEEKATRHVEVYMDAVENAAVRLINANDARVAAARDAVRNSFPFYVPCRTHVWLLRADRLHEIVLLLKTEQLQRIVQWTDCWEVRWLQS